MIIPTDILLTLLIRRKVFSSELLVSNTVDYVVGLLLFPMVEVLPVRSERLRILGQDRVGNVLVPVIFQRDGRIVADGPDLAQGFCETQQAEGRCVDQELERGGFIVVEREAGEE